MKDLNWDDKGYLVGGKRISNHRFADDIVLVSTSTAEVDEMLNELKVAVALQQVDSWVYLGIELNMGDDLAPEIARRRRAAWAAFSSIREVTDQVKDAGLRASIFNASVLPAMCYVTETWPDNKTIARAISCCRAGKLRIVHWRDVF
ncbi:unnamed protein product [Heligmosomoides polygyrus]|uniref:Reverse transcriptase domain-containing protein n=1 Tax=Heligmosomoides polygyrus TaxID=6339 RepID=A0A183GNJ2_HELPZ|nr:unnamed protein product [Heligmosomoides polygyrus]